MRTNMHIVDKLLLLITQFVEAHQRLELGTKVVSFGSFEFGCVLAAISVVFRLG